MAGNIWNNDSYDLRKYSPGSMDYFLDIGGCVGTTSLMFKCIDPLCKVIACEPCKDDFETMKAVAGFWGVKCKNIALGDGKPLCFGPRRQGEHRFYTSDEKQWWPETPEYLVKSYSLPELVKMFGVKGRYIIKVDSEGGERFLLDDSEAIEIIKGCVQFNMEYHRGIGGPQEQWHEWLRNFEDTHELLYRTLEREGRKYKYVPSIGPNERQRSEYILVRR